MDRDRHLFDQDSPEGRFVTPDVSEAFRVADSLFVAPAQVDGRPALMFLLSFGSIDAPPILLELEYSGLDDLLQAIDTAGRDAINGRGVRL